MRLRIKAIRSAHVRELRVVHVTGAVDELVVVVPERLDAGPQDDPRAEEDPEGDAGAEEDGHD